MNASVLQITATPHWALVKKTSGETMLPLTVSDLLNVARYGFANLPCDEQLLVSLSHTTKRQHALGWPRICEHHW